MKRESKNYAINEVLNEQNEHLAKKPISIVDRN